MEKPFRDDCSYKGVLNDDLSTAKRFALSAWLGLLRSLEVHLCAGVVVAGVESLL
jgi:hypothetical protein